MCHRRNLRKWDIIDTHESGTRCLFHPLPRNNKSRERRNDRPRGHSRVAGTDSARCGESRASRGEKPPSLHERGTRRGGRGFFLSARRPPPRESVEAIYPSRWAGVRAPSHTSARRVNTHHYADIHVRAREEDGEERGTRGGPAENGSPRCHAGRAKGDEAGVPAPFTPGAFQPRHPTATRITSLSLSLSLLLILSPLSATAVGAATQMASRRAHFISASYSRPARRRK